MGFKEEVQRERVRIEQAGFEKKREQELLADLGEKETRSEAVNSKLEEYSDQNALPGAKAAKLQYDAVLGRVSDEELGLTKPARQPRTAATPAPAGRVTAAPTRPAQAPPGVTGASGPSGAPSGPTGPNTGDGK